MKPMVVLAATVMVVGLAQAQAYKWTDENGKLHFSDEPPPDRKATKLTIRPAMAESSTSRDRPDWKSQLQESGMRRAQEQAKQEAAERASQVGERNCRTARGELDLLQGGRVYRYGKDGQKQYLEDRDRPAALAAAQANVEKYCR